MHSDDAWKVARRELLKGAGAALLVPGIHIVPRLFAGEIEGDPGWHKDIYRQLHIDAHFAGCQEIYNGFSAEAAAQMFQDAGFQLLSYFALCSGGYSYYPTKIGVVHPALKLDFTGDVAKALKKRGIRAIAYLGATAERKYHKEHPDWMHNPDPRRTSAEPSGERATMCLNSPWVDDVRIPQLKELLALYDLDGFFIDGILQPTMQSTCYCRYCRESFRDEVGGDIPTSDGDPQAFAYRKWATRKRLAYMERVQRALDAVKPGVTVINNWAWMARWPLNPPSWVKQINWDTPPPSTGLYALNFSVEARYLSTLREVSWSCHNTRGNGWGDYSLREPVAYMQETAILLAACGRSFLCDDAYPTGNPDPAVYAVYKKVNQRTRELEPFLKGCRPVKEVAVLHSADSLWSKAPMKPSPQWMAGPPYYSVLGAHKVLVDGHVQMGILNSDVLADTLDEYKVVVLPEQRILSPKECDKLRRFVQNGGSLIATSETGTRGTDNSPLQDFALADILGVKYVEVVASNRCFLRGKQDLERFGVPHMDVQVSGKYVRVRATTATTLLELVPAFGPRSAPAATAEGPGVSVNQFGKGKAIYCAPDLFATYYRDGTSALARLALWILDTIHPQPERAIALEDAPANVELFYNYRNSERFVHLVNFSGDKREVGPPVIREMPPVVGIRVRIKASRRPQQVVSVPEMKAMRFEFRDGWVSFEAAPLAVHSAYMIQS